MASIETIEGIGGTFGKKLRGAGINTTQGLLKAGGTKKGRDEISAATGLSGHQVLEWVNRADLMRVKGVGEEYSDLLEAAGVDSVKELAQRNAANLTQAMADTNAKKKLVRRVPAESMVSRWVAHAKKLPRAVSH